MNSQKLIDNYVEASNAQDAQRVASCFLPDGTVHDEGALHRGRAEIAAWAQDAATRYDAVMEPLGVATEGGRHTLRAKVRGNFPGSPAVLAFHFVLQADGIDTLEVTA